MDFGNFMLLNDEEVQILKIKPTGRDGGRWGRKESRNRNFFKGKDEEKYEDEDELQLQHQLAKGSKYRQHLRDQGIHNDGFVLGLDFDRVFAVKKGQRILPAGGGAGVPSRDRSWTQSTLLLFPLISEEAHRIPDRPLDCQPGRIGLLSSVYT